MKHLRYACYLVSHKLWVLRYGLVTRAPLWRLLVHDLSKLRPDEWVPYAERFYGPTNPKDRYERAWLKHQHRNLHHWQSWVLRLDSGGEKVLEMPEMVVREMVADWCAAGRVITGRLDVHAWYERNQQRIRLHPTTRERVLQLLERLKN